MLGAESTSLVVTLAGVWAAATVVLCGLVGILRWRTRRARPIRHPRHAVPGVSVARAVTVAEIQRRLRREAARPPRSIPVRPRLGHPRLGHPQPGSGSARHTWLEDTVPVDPIGEGDERRQ